MGSHGPEWQTAVARGQSAFDRVRVTRPPKDFGGVGIDDKREARLSKALSGGVQGPPDVGACATELRAWLGVSSH